LPLTTARTVAAVLARLGKLGLDVTGIRAIGPDSIELTVHSAPWSERPGRLVAHAWNVPDNRIQVRRGPEGLRARLEIQPGIWLSWQERPPRARAVEEPSIRAYAVGPASDDDHEEVVMASSADEAAAYYAVGWGLDRGALVAVAWDPQAGGANVPRAPRQHQLFRVLKDGRVARLAT